MISLISLLNVGLHTVYYHYYYLFWPYKSEIHSVYKVKITKTIIFKIEIIHVEKEKEMRMYMYM